MHIRYYKMMYIIYIYIYVLYGYQASNSEFGPTDQATQLVLEVRFKKLAQRLAMLGDASVGSERSVSNTN